MDDKAKCVECWYCKTRVFRDKDELTVFMEEKRHPSTSKKAEVTRKFEKDGEVRLYWCVQRPTTLWLEPPASRKCTKFII